MAQPVLGRSVVITRPRSRQRGFTLVELGAVVVIVSILAVIAVVSYKKMITASHSSEATHMINSIRVAQEAYKAETGTYANISSNLSITGSSGTSCTNSASLYPNTSPGNFKTGWGAACTGCNAPLNWDTIPIHVDGAVMYGYTTIAGFAGTGPAALTTMIGRNGVYTLNFPATPATDWFVAAACGDPDGNGTRSAYVTSSFSNDIFESNDGE